MRQTPDGTLVLNRIEIFVRFSGYKQETATLLITVPSGEDSTGGSGVWEGASPEACERILAKQIIEVRGVKSGERIVRYIGFLVGGAVGEKTSLGAEVRYEIAAP